MNPVFACSCFWRGWNFEDFSIMPTDFACSSIFLSFFAGSAASVTLISLSE
jgi:hypothetical protein